METLVSSTGLSATEGSPIPQSKETLVSSTGLPAAEGKGRRRKARKLAGGRGETEGKGRRRKVRKLAGEQGETEGKGRRRKVQKLAGGPAVASHGNSDPLVTDPQQEDPNQMGIGGSEAQLIGAGEAQYPSVFITLNRGRWFSCSDRYYPLHKVEVASDVSTSRGANVATMTSDIGFKTFVSVRSRWIVGVGGNPGHTVIFDTKMAEVTKMSEVIAGPKPVTPKLCPVVTAVGYRVYALSVTAQFEEGPDFMPWFEVLDLSKAMDADENLSLLKHCSWEALPSPPFFACKLPTAEDCVMPPSITVVSYVVVEHYIVLSVIGEPKPHGVIRSRKLHMATYAFDTKSEEWHKVNDTCLPFYGAATKLGHSSCVFLGLCQKNGPVNAYRICVSPSGGSSAMAGLSGKDGAPKLSITVFPVEATKALEEIKPKREYYFTSMDGRFSTLLDVLGNGGCHMKYCEDIDEFYSVMLNAELKTYQIESESLALLETEDEEKLLSVKPEIVVSSKWEQNFGISSAPGFYPTPNMFVASI